MLRKEERQTGQYEGAQAQQERLTCEILFIWQVHIKSVGKMYLLFISDMQLKHEGISYSFLMFGTWSEKTTLV